MGGKKLPTREERLPKPPRHLADMRHVYETEEPLREEPRYLKLREMKHSNFEGFLKQLNQYEKDFADEVRKRRLDYRAARKANLERKAMEPTEVVKKGADAGTMCALELIEKVLREAK